MVRFVRKLIEIKKEKLQKDLEHAQTFFNRDFILKVHCVFVDSTLTQQIELRFVKPEIWRRFKVSGGIKLNVLHDKVLGPLMGWVRHYHGYKFTDKRDGACIGPTHSTAVDMMHTFRDGKDDQFVSFNIQKVICFWMIQK
jgi:hypothetical protein